MLKLAIFIIALSLLLSGCSKPLKRNAPTQPDKIAQPSHRETKTIDIKVVVWNETKNKPVDQLEIWAKGLGSWCPDMKHGGGSTVIPNIAIQEVRKLVVYPDGRNGKEIEVQFTASENMKSMSDRDSLIVEIYDDKIIVFGVAIGGINKEFDR